MSLNVTYEMRRRRTTTSIGNLLAAQSNPCDAHFEHGSSWRWWWWWWRWSSSSTFLLVQIVPAPYVSPRRLLQTIFHLNDKDMMSFSPSRSPSEQWVGGRRAATVPTFTSVGAEEKEEDEEENNRSIGVHRGTSSISALFLLSPVLSHFSRSIRRENWLSRKMKWKEWKNIPISNHRDTLLLLIQVYLPSIIRDLFAQCLGVCLSTKNAADERYSSMLKDSSG